VPHRSLRTPTWLDSGYVGLDLGNRCDKRLPIVFIYLMFETGKICGNSKKNVSLIYHLLPYTRMLNVRRKLLREKELHREKPCSVFLPVAS
jgi:hypothetical protein